ncbi:MAG: metallophosphoesterase family protein [Bacilli bacterium]|nr:metallophosphoesterase family protein [Bacilli bacterium]
MRIAIISDIHANKHALDLVLKDIERRGVDKIICLGDIVTKYFYPDYCVDAVSKNCEIVIRGNCDNIMVKNPNFAWARGKLKNTEITDLKTTNLISSVPKSKMIDGLNYLENLPEHGQIELGKAIINLYHSNPKDLESVFNPVVDVKISTNRTNNVKEQILDYKEMFSDDKPSTSVVGHTHMDYIGTEQNGELVIEPRESEGKIILPTDRAIINTGSAGENIEFLGIDKTAEVIRPELTYAILDDRGLDQGFTAQIIKVPYKETFKIVFDDSVDKQIIGKDNGGFPYSPSDTIYRGNNVVTHNPELRNYVSTRIAEMNDAESKRKAIKADLEAKKKVLEEMTPAAEPKTK